MPVSVMHVVRADKVRGGDVLEDKDVVKVDSKVKKAHVTFANGTTKSYDRDDEVPVIRQEQTKEEKEADERAWAIRNINSYINNTKTVEDVLARATAKVDSDGRIDGYVVEELIAVNARVAVVKSLTNIAEQREVDLLDAAAILVASHLTRNQFSNPLSRSTSTVDNLMVDCQRAAVEQFAYEFGHGMVRDLAFKLVGEK